MTCIQIRYNPASGGPNAPSPSSVSLFVHFAHGVFYRLGESLANKFGQRVVSFGVMLHRFLNT